MDEAQLERAVIKVLNGKYEGKSIGCRFNPTEYDLKTGVTYATQENPGSTSSPRQFVSGQSGELSMELFFDTTESGTDVRDAYLHDLDLLMEVDPELHAPPRCRFTWGGGVDFKGFLESADKTFTRFHPNGVPVRATVDVTFVEYTPPGKSTAESGWESGTESSATKRESTDRTKVWTVTEGDTLWSIAAAEYDSPGRWRAIADANDVGNPRDLRPGRELELPPL